MVLQIVAESGVSPFDWEMLVSKCQYATYFHTYEWASVSARLTQERLRPAARLLIFDDGVRVLLPISTRSLVFGMGELHMLTASVKYGGWLSESSLSKEHHFRILDWLRSKNFVMRQNPYSPFFIAPPDNAQIRESFTQVVKLQQPLTKGWSKGRKSDLSKAIRSGVSIRQAASDEDWQGFLDTYHSSIHRWGSQSQTTYSNSFFHALRKMESKRIKLWIALFEEKVVAGAICLYQGCHVTYWIGAFESEYSSVRPVSLLMKTIMENAMDQGCEWFDLGSSGGLEGVEAFKAGFGAIKLPCNSYTYYSSYWLSAIKKGLAWRRSFRQ